MSQHYQVLTPEPDAARQEAHRRFAFDVMVGLSETPKHLSSRYIYDAEGSKLFEHITELDAYYLTGCEREILETHAGRIAALMGASSPDTASAFNLVDLGAGDARKTRVLIDGFRARGLAFRYVPVDISEAAMRELVAALGRSHPDLEVAGVVAEYFDALSFLARTDPEHSNLVLFLGSNIGNFNRANARAMLRQLWTVCRSGDHLLIGFDLKKDIDALLLAYNDPQGVTAQFNKNLLGRINRELGGHFELDSFRHYATYDVFSGAMQSYLVSLVAQEVRVDGLSTSFTFGAWEPIHTEYSHKYLPEDIADLGAATGYEPVEMLMDRRRYFADAIWRVDKPGT